MSQNRCNPPKSPPCEPSEVNITISVSESGGRYVQGFWRHGRFFGSWKPEKYLVPIDSEELNRLDIFHKVFLLARQGRPFHVPIVRQRPRIMDLGTGTGIWAINMAEDYFQQGEIMIVDLNRIQPPLIPVGIVPRQFDIEEPDWTPLLDDCDFIHMRMLLGSLPTELWPRTYRNVFEQLAPGIGHMEHVEVDWTPRCDDDTMPANSALQQWAELYYSGMDQFNRSARVRPQDTRQMMEAAGFTDVREEVIKAFVCPWSVDRREREIARWFNFGLSHSLESLGIVPLVEQHGLTVEEVKELCQTARKETCILRYHIYCNIHVWTARKPGAPQ